MFTFLNSSILFGLFAAAIPLIIHLITRQKVKKIYFSSLYFLRELRTQKIRRIKIRHILLLIIRTLILLLLILTFARPTLKVNFNNLLDSEAKTSAVIIFDNSLSMARENNGQTLFARAKEKLNHIEPLFQTGDELYAITSSQDAAPVFAGARYDINKVMQSISRVEISHGTTDLISALYKAKGILENSKNLNKEIYLISDLQKIGFEAMDEFITPVFPTNNIKLFVIPVTDGDLNNLGIMQIETANQIIEKGKVFEIDVIIKNYGTLEERNKLVQLIIEGKRVAQRTVDLKPGESKKIDFKVIPDQTGLLAGSAFLEDDDLMLDNRRFFTFNVPETIRILILGNEATDRHYLKIATAISPNMDVVAKKFTEIKPNEINEYGVVVLSNVPYLQAERVSAIRDYVEQGGALVIFAGDDVDLKSYNITLNRELSLPVYSETVGNLDAKKSWFSFEKIDYSHPVFQGMFDNKPERIESPKFFFAVKSKLQPGNSPIIELNDGNPLLTETIYGRGKVFTFNTAVDPDWSDFYLRGIFVPLLNRSFVYLAGVSEKNEHELLTNLEIRSILKSGSDFSNFRMEKADASVERIRPLIKDGRYQIKYNHTDKIGIYTLFAGDKQIDRWAVNSWPRESSNETIAEEELKKIIGENILSINRSEDVSASVVNTRYGQELWKYFIIAVLMLLITEMIIARESKVPTQV